MKKSGLKIGLCLLVLASVFSCKESDDDGYKGKNQLYITTDDDAAMYESDKEPITAVVTMTKSYDKDVTLNIEMKNVTNEIGGIVTVEPEQVIIKAGQKSGNFTITSNNANLLETTVELEFGLKTLPEANMEMKDNLKITVRPIPTDGELTPEQLAMIEGYKTSMSLDLSKWMGLISVNVKIVSPAGGALEPFVEEFTKDFTGKTLITLSENATVAKPVLKMLANPLGMTDYLYWVLKKETIENNEYWFNEDGSGIYEEMMRLINLSSTSAETFEISLDNIEFETPVGGVSKIHFLGTKLNLYDEEIVTVPFKYDYSAWNRLKTLIDANNTDAIEYNENGATVNPEGFLFYSPIDIDEWENEPSDWTEPAASLDTKTNTMTFTFGMDHYSANGYSKVVVTYTVK